MDYVKKVYLSAWNSELGCFVKWGATGGGEVPQGPYLLSENPVPGLVSICYLIKVNVTTTSHLPFFSQALFIPPSSCSEARVSLRCPSGVSNHTSAVGSGLSFVRITWEMELYGLQRKMVLRWSERGVSLLLWKQPKRLMP